MRPTRYLAALLLGGTLLTPAVASAQTPDAGDRPSLGTNPSDGRETGRADGGRVLGNGTTTGDRGAGDRSARTGQGPGGDYSRAECEMWREHFQRHFQRHHSGRYDDRRHWRDEKGYRHHRYHHGREDERRYGRGWDDDGRRGVWRDDREFEDFRRWREERDRDDYRRWREERGEWRDDRGRGYGDWRDDRRDGRGWEDRQRDERDYRRDDRSRGYGDWRDDGDRRDWRNDRDAERGDWREDRRSDERRDYGRPSDRWRGDTGRNGGEEANPIWQDGGDDRGDGRSGDRDWRRGDSFEGYDEYDGGGEDRSSPDAERSEDRGGNRDRRDGEIEENRRI